MPAEVFFTDLRTNSGNNLLDKTGRLFDRAGLTDLIKPRDLVAVKLHFGERGQPRLYQTAVCPGARRPDQGSRREAFPDGRGHLYYGNRGNAVDHLETALANGFAYACVNAPVVIADGLLGMITSQCPSN